MKNMPRKAKLAFYSLSFLVIAAVLFFCSDWPSPTPEIAFRRAEQQQLIGPAEIIASLDFPCGSYDHMLIGRSEHGYTTFEYCEPHHWDSGKLRYFPKTGGATLFCPEYLYYDENGEAYILIFLFPEMYAAPNAEMTLSIFCEEESETYLLKALRQDAGYYIFPLSRQEMKGQFLRLLQQALTGSCSECDLSGTVDISVTYFDRNNVQTGSYGRSVTK